jgi:hypothetical protein
MRMNFAKRYQRPPKSFDHNSGQKQAARLYIRAALAAPKSGLQKANQLVVAHRQHMTRSAPLISVLPNNPGEVHTRNSPTRSVGRGRGRVSGNNMPGSSRERPECTAVACSDSRRNSSTRQSREFEAAALRNTSRSTHAAVHWGTPEPSAAALVSQFL